MSGMRENLQSLVYSSWSTSESWRKYASLSNQGDTARRNPDFGTFITNQTFTISQNRSRAKEGEILKEGARKFRIITRFGMPQRSSSAALHMIGYGFCRCSWKTNFSLQWFSTRHLGKGTLTESIGRSPAPIKRLEVHFPVPAVPRRAASGRGARSPQNPQGLLTWVTAAKAVPGWRRVGTSTPLEFSLWEPGAVGRAAAASATRQMFGPRTAAAQGPNPSQARGVCSPLLPFPFLPEAVVGAGEHGEKNQQGYQQVRRVDREQNEALALRLRSQMLRRGEIVEQDVCEDGNQSCSDVGGVDNRRSPYPFAAPCTEAERKRYWSVLEEAGFSGFSVDRTLTTTSVTGRAISHITQVAEKTVSTGSNRGKSSTFMEI